MCFFGLVLRIAASSISFKPPVILLPAGRKGV